MDRSQSLRRVCIALMLLCLLATPIPIRAAAPPGSTQPSATAPPGPALPDRLVGRFDFEERQLGNFEDLPRHWDPIGRPSKNLDPTFLSQPLHRMLAGVTEFPDYNLVAFDTSQKHSGDYSFHLGVNGGNAGAFLEANVVPAIAGSDYRITAQVLTPALRYARAQLVAYLIDGAGRRIDASLVSSQPVVTDGHWQVVTVALRGNQPSAASIGLQLELLQPQARPDAALGSHQVVYEDVHADAWFDDIMIWQVPRITLTTSSSVNIIRAPEKPALMIAVADPAGRALTAAVTVYDLEGRPVARDRRQLPDPRNVSWSWTPALQRFGWYQAELVLTDGIASPPSGATPAARQTSAFLFVPDEPAVGADGAERFTLDSQDLPDARVDAGVEILRQLGLRGLLASCWERTTGAAALRERQHRLSLLLGRLAAMGCRATLSLSPLPDELARQVDADPRDPLTALSANPDLWKPFLAPFLLQQGQQVSRWQLGTSAQSAGLARPDLARVLATVSSTFAETVAQPRLAIPWRVDQPRRADIKTDVSYSMDLPPSVGPDYLGQYLAAWTGRDAADQTSPTSVGLTLHEPELDPAISPRSGTQRITDLALRILCGMEAGAESFTLAQPWSAASPAGGAIQPDATLGVFAALAHRLDGRRLLGRMQLGGGVECMIFSGATDTDGTLALWATSAATQGAIVEMHLGPAPQAVDLFGNHVALPTVDGCQRLSVASQPVFIQGADTKLALFRAAITLTPTFLESTQAPQGLTLTIANPWARTISGTLVVVQPQNWHLEPRRISFTLDPGQTRRTPINVGLPPSELIGPKLWLARVDLMADQHHSLDLTLPLLVGIKDIVLDAVAALEPDAKTGRTDVVVTQTITNRGPEARSLYSFASLPGLPQQERIVPHLDPGQSVVRRFRFQGAGDGPHTPDVRVGVRDIDGPMLLNKILSLRSGAR